MTEEGKLLEIYLPAVTSTKVEEVLISNMELYEPFDEAYPVSNEFQFGIALRQRHPEINNNESFYTEEDETQQNGSTMDSQLGMTANFTLEKAFIADSEEKGEFACYSYNMQRTVSSIEYPNFMDSCQIWYKKNGEEKQLFKWEDQMWCQIDYPVIEYQDLAGNTYLIVNTIRRVSNTYDECLIFGNTGNGEFGLIADMQDCIVELEHLSNTLMVYQYEHHMDMEGGLTKIGEQYSMATLENGQFSIRRSQLNN